MKRTSLKWFEYFEIAVLALGFIFAFIPVSPWSTSSPESEPTYRWFSLLTFIPGWIGDRNNIGLYWTLFVLFLLFSLAGITFVVFKKKVLFKVSTGAAAVCLMLFAQKGWPINIFVSTVSMVYLTLILVVLVVEGILNRREIANRATKEKYDNHNPDDTEQ